MGLQIRRIEYRNFRNYQSFLLDGVGESTLFIEHNGKTKEKKKKKKMSLLFLLDLMLLVRRIL